MFWLQLTRAVSEVGANGLLLFHLPYLKGQACLFPHETLVSLADLVLRHIFQRENFDVNSLKLETSDTIKCLHASDFSAISFQLLGSITPHYQQKFRAFFFALKPGQVGWSVSGGFELLLSLQSHSFPNKSCIVLGTGIPVAENMIILIYSIQVYGQNVEFEREVSQ